MFSRKKEQNSEDVKLAESVLNIIETQKDKVTILDSKQWWWSYDKDYSIRFAVMINDIRCVFTAYRNRCFGKIKYQLTYNNQVIQCGENLSRDIFNALFKKDVNSKEYLHSLL